MISIDDYPKSVKKTLRYIKQDAPLTKLKELEKILLKSIHNRKEALRNKENTSELHNEL
ncbi:hypothetical protein V7158_28565 [Priestia megaterium]|uniref:hypothetical protein n=1 Tax=Priestia megaterium TaxID=1404 RepID=UPI002FFFFB53